MPIGTESCHRMSATPNVSSYHTCKLIYSQCCHYIVLITIFYRQAVMKEAMRCHPGVSYPLERIVPHGGITICAVPIAEGTVIGVSAPVIHSDTSIFGEDALSFNPERWLSPDEDHVKRMDRHLMTVSYFICSDLSTAAFPRPNANPCV